MTALALRSEQRENNALLAACAANGYRDATVATGWLLDESDPVHAVYEAYRVAVKNFNESDEDQPNHKELEDAFQAAQDRFVSAKTRSLSGVLLKLKHLANEDDEAPVLDAIDRRLIDQIVRDMRSIQRLAGRQLRKTS